MNKITTTLKRIYLTATVTKGFFPRLRIIFLHLTLSIKRWLGCKPEFKTYKEITVWSNGVSAPFFIKRQLDFDVLQDAFADDQYEIDDSFTPQVIFDLGSNVGATVVKFCLQYKDAKVYAVEPDPTNFESLKKNTAFFKDRVITINKAISGTTGEKVTFYTGSQYHWSSSLYNRTEKYIDDTIRIETLTIDSMIQEYNLEQVDILKCDIEGAEEDAFRSCTNLSKVKYIVGELHPTLIKSSTDDFFKIFTNYDLLALDTKGWVFKLKNSAY